MNVRVALLAASMSVLPSVGDVTAASAATSRTCVVASTWSFNPPLRLGTTTGSGSVDYTVICADGSSEQLVTFSGGSAQDQGFTYAGNCALAIIGSGAVVAYLLGGTTYVQVGAPIPRPNVFGQQAVWQLVPNEVCNESSATAVAVWTEAGL